MNVMERRNGCSRLVLNVDLIYPINRQMNQTNRSPPEKTHGGEAQSVCWWMDDEHSVSTEVDTHGFRMHPCISCVNYFLPETIVFLTRRQHPTVHFRLRIEFGKPFIFCVWECVFFFPRIKLYLIAIIDHGMREYRNCKKVYRWTIYWWWWSFCVSPNPNALLYTSYNCSNLFDGRIYVHLLFGIVSFIKFWDTIPFVTLIFSLFHS